MLSATGALVSCPWILPPLHFVYRFQKVGLSATCGLLRGCRRRDPGREARRLAPVNGEVAGIVGAEQLNRAEEATQMAAHRRQRALAVAMDQAIDDEAV